MADKIIPIELEMGESAELSNDVSVMPVEVQRYMVRLGFTAPKAIRVDRAEIVQLREDLSKEQASSSVTEE